MKLQNKPVIRYLGENGFRRSEKDAWIHLLRNFKSGANPNNIELLESFRELEVFSKEKKLNNGIKRITTLLTRMGLIEKRNNLLYSTPMAIQDIIDKKFDSNLFSPIEWGFLKSIIILSEGICTKSKKENSKRFLYDFIKYIKNHKYVELKFNDIFLQIQNNNWDPEALNFNDFLHSTIYNLNKKTKSNIAKINNKKIFWSKYYKVYKAYIEGDEQYINHYIELFWLYKKQNIYPWKRTKNFENKLTGFNYEILKRHKPSHQEILECFNVNNFHWVRDANLINENIKEYFLNYSLKDNTDITRRLLSMTSLFNFYKKNKELYVSVPKEYIDFCDKLIEHYDLITSIISDNPCVTFDGINKYLGLKSAKISWESIHQIIEKIGVKRIDKIIHDIDKPSKLKIHFDEIKTLEFNSVTIPTWLEYFIMLKIIYLWPTLDEKIWNGSLDKQLKPMSFAAGGRSDLYFELGSNKTIVEATLSTGDSQAKMEATSVTKYMYNYNADLCIFIAPEISQNTKAQMSVGYYYGKEGVFITKNKIKYFTTQEFANIDTSYDIFVS